MIRIAGITVNEFAVTWPGLTGSNSSDLIVNHDSNRVPSNLLIRMGLTDNFPVYSSGRYVDGSSNLGYFWDFGPSPSVANPTSLRVRFYRRPFGTPSSASDVVLLLHF